MLRSPARFTVWSGLFSIRQQCEATFPAPSRDVTGVLQERAFVGWIHGVGLHTGNKHSPCFSIGSPMDTAKADDKTQLHYCFTTWADWCFRKPHEQVSIPSLGV